MIIAAFLANRLLDIADTIPVHKNIVDSFNNNPMSDSVIYDYKNYPKDLYKSPGEKAPNREAFGKFGSWLNTYVRKKYGRPLAFASSATGSVCFTRLGWFMGFSSEGLYLPRAVSIWITKGFSYCLSSSIAFIKSGTADSNFF